MKLVIRIDDVGYTNVHNVGSFQTIEEGIATSADVMLDTPGTVDALERLRDYPWISIGWHSHFWGSPVLPREEVPSLLRADGHFRADILRAADFSPEELANEMRAQLLRCHRIYGRVPDCCGLQFDDSLFSRVQREICEEFGICIEFADTMSMPSDINHALGGGPEKSAAMVSLDPKWADRKIIMGGFEAVRELMTDSITELEKYDPISFFTQDKGRLFQLPEDSIPVLPWHPGCVDYYVYRLGDQGAMARNFTISRTVDAFALCSAELKTWVQENQIELVNLRDALYGTKEYQNHLRAAGSDLAICSRA